ncbi:MAG: sortase [Clostridia bacterium]|nr:sortase [Clostridia bacterium]
MKRRKKKGTFLIRTGILLFAAAVVIAGYNLYDGFRAEHASRQILGPLEAVIAPDASILKDNEDALPENLIVVDTPKETEIPDYILNPDMEMPTSRHDGQDCIGILEIPALELKLPVISEWSYPRLKIAPCRYTGSAYKNNLVISAHNYARHFGSLKELDGGERVIFTDADGNQFDYRVDLRETLDPRDVDYMINSEWDLTLFTCTVGGSYRVTVRCSLKCKLQADKEGIYCE